MAYKQSRVAGQRLTTPAGNSQSAHRVPPDQSRTLPGLGPHRQRTAPKQLIRKRSVAAALQVGAFEAVALPAEQLEVVHCGGAAQGHWDDMIILKIEFAATLRALAAVPLEDGPAHLTKTRRPPRRPVRARPGSASARKC
jgi:hypothetical protein